MVYSLITCNLTGSSESEGLDEVFLWGWSQCCSSTSSFRLCNRWTSTAGTDEIGRPIGPLCTLIPTHTVTDIYPFQRLSKGASDTLHT